MALRWFESRVRNEQRIMAIEFPQFTLFHSCDQRYFQGWHTTTTSRLLFNLTLPLPIGYPEVMPALYVTYPSTLYKCAGGTINSEAASHAFHTLGQSPNGYVKICHFDEANWDASKTCVGILFKGTIWCEAYAVHLRTGLDISEIIDNWRRNNRYGNRTR